MSEPKQEMKRVAPLVAYVEDCKAIQDCNPSILYRYGDHKICNLGNRVFLAVNQILDAVEGLDLGK